MSELERLREEVKKKRTAASNKINRIRRNTGAEVANTNFDPRRNAGIENRYNAAQLRTYLSSLNDFMRRGNQFVAGSRGAPIRRGVALRFQRNVNEARAAANQHAASMGDVFVPMQGTTVAQGKSMRHPMALGSVVNGPYSGLDTDISNVVSDTAAQKLTAAIIRQLGANYLPGELKKGRENLIKALDIMGESDMVAAVNDLSEYQFDVLWNGSSFAEITFMKYDLEKARAAGTSKERWQDKAIDNAADDIREFLDWAADLPEERPETDGQT